MALIKDIDWDKVDTELPGSVVVSAVLLVRSLDQDGDFRTSIFHDQADRTMRLGLLHEALLAIDEETRGGWRHVADDGDDDAV